MAFRRFFERLFGSFAGRESKPIDFLVVGIGNIGSRYEKTRHNVGFFVADLLWQRMGTPRKQPLNHALVACGDCAGKHIALVWPQEFVNRSGEAVAELVQKFSISKESVLVLVDDFSLPVGALRLRAKGSDGGHNGLKSIISGIGDQFPRIRIGIGPLPPGANVVDFVLGEFAETEQPVLQAVVKRAADVCEMCLTEGIAKALNAYNRV